MTAFNVYDVFTESFHEQIKHLEDDIKEWERVCDDPNKSKIYLKFHVPMIQIQLKMLFNALNAITLSIKILQDEVNTLPNHKVFEDTKKEMGKKVENTLSSLQAVIDGEKEIRSRYNDIYG